MQDVRATKKAERRSHEIEQRKIAQEEEVRFRTYKENDLLNFYISIDYLLKIVNSIDSDLFKLININEEDKLKIIDL